MTRNTLRYGSPAAFPTSLGICSGLTVHAVASAAGLSIVLSRSAMLFEISKLLGAAYLIVLLPQFISPGDQVIQRSLLLVGIHIGPGLVWLTAYAAFIDRLRHLLGRPAVRRLLDRATGGLLSALGLRLAFDRR